MQKRIVPFPSGGTDTFSSDVFVHDLCRSGATSLKLTDMQLIEIRRGVQ